MRRWPVTARAFARARRDAVAGAGGDPQRLRLAAGPAVRIAVRAEGWTRVSQPALVAAGLDPGVDPARLRLYTDGIEQAIAADDNGDTVFDSDEALEFYGVGRDTPWTDTRTYWLTVGDGRRQARAIGRQPGRRPGRRQLHLHGRDARAPPLLRGAQERGGDQFLRGAGRRKRRRARPCGCPTSRRPTAPCCASSSRASPSARTSVQVSLGGQAVGTCRFEGQVRFTCTLAPAAIAEGDNSSGSSRRGWRPTTRWSPPSSSTTRARSSPTTTG